jgi:surface antigen
MHMRTTLAALATVATAAVAFGTAASPASADDPNVTYSHGGTMAFSRTLGCTTQYKTGVLGQYGASGYFIDGCTVKLDCPSHTGLASVKHCDVSGYSFIDTYYDRGDRVSMNSRIRRLDAGGRVSGWSDRSCWGPNRCENTDSSVIYPGQSASVQCNGVREARAYNWAQAYCSVKLSYRAADPPAKTPIGTQVGSGECTDWALDRRPDLRAIVSGNAQNWAAQARTAGRPMSKTPSQGAVMVLQGGVMGAFAGTGHVAYVESVQRDAAGNPTSFVVSEQNWNGNRHSTTRTIQVGSLPATGVDFIG